jgi:hypothetical protein
MAREKTTKRTAQETLNAFAAEIGRQQDLVYGAALFFECLTVLHDGQPAVIETYRKQYRNIISMGNATVDRANALLEAARSDNSRCNEVDAFSFTPFSEHPAPAEMVRRAETLIATYRQIFPERPLAEEFTHGELLQLIDAASDALAAS